jgi:flagella basal body P-ring formation protein FlgA
LIGKLSSFFLFGALLISSDSTFALFEQVTLQRDSRVTIEFPGEIFVSRKTRYSIYDLADIRTEGAGKLGAIQDFEFDFSPYGVDPGAPKNPEKFILTQAELVKILKRNPTFSSQQYQLKIPQQVTIQVFQEKILAIEVERKIKNHLNSLCIDCRFKLSLSKMPTVKTSDWKIDFSGLKERGSFLLSIVGEPTWVSGFVKTEKPVVVAQKDIRVGEELNSKDFSIEYADITYLKDSLFALEQIKNTLAVNHISAFSPVSTLQIKRKPDVLRGQQVQIQAGDEQHEVTTSAISEQDGTVGEMIRLKLMGSQKVISGEVINKGIVKIQ